jgi:tRNA 5-methylaminomethyl-2-thiouridine biosynthesis bifunctional protein
MRSGTGAQSTAPVLVIGAGLAGCAMAWALAEQGRDCIVFERQAAPALETSGNPGGLFHGIVNPQDGAHARFNRAAALEAQRAVSIALTQHGVPGSLRGLLRLETLQDAGEALRTMQATLARLGLSRDYVQALSAQEASAHAGIALRYPAWWYPGGGWVQPSGLARSFLECAGRRASLRANCAVESLSRGNCGWQLLDARGSTLAESGTVVLANAGDALRLLRPWMPTSQPDAWPLLKVRGQISTMATEAGSGWPLPRMPITGAGYVLPSVDGRTIFGATSQVGDDDPAVRDRDHRHNLAQLSRLLGVEPQVDVSCFGGRTGWRWTTDDRLPVLGAVPDVAAAMATERLEQPVQVPRLTGLYACTAFGSRGITWAALAAQVVAASITGAPVPIESSLLDSVDAARFATRRSRRGR